MVVIREGRVEDGALVLRDAIELPNGTAVRVVIAVLQPIAEDVPADEEEDFSSASFFGAWADREDLADSAAWVTQQRDRWRQRTTPTA